MTAIYSTARPNAPVLLHEGPMEFSKDGKVAAGDGKLSLTWLPAPRIEFEFATPITTDMPRGPGAGMLTLQRLSTSVPALYTGAAVLDPDARVRGFAREGIKFGRASHATKLTT